VEDDHVDRPGVEARRRAQLTGTNRSTGLIRSHYQTPLRRKKNHLLHFAHRRPGGLRRSDQTRSHPELGRQTLPRQWYYVSRPGRVGRRQARYAQRPSSRTPNGLRNRLSENISVSRSSRMACRMGQRTYAFVRNALLHSPLSSSTPSRFSCSASAALSLAGEATVLRRR
jgi:hypothetical protein